MRISVEQMLSSSDKDENLDRVRSRIAAAGAQGADLVVFPEATMKAFLSGRLDTAAESLDGPFATAVAQAAEAAGTTVVLGLFRPADQVERRGKRFNRVYNTLLVAGPGVRAHYDKIHLFDAFDFRESDTIAPGTDLVTVEVPVGGGPGKGDAGTVTIGLATCFDLRFPEQFTGLAAAGAQLIVLPASWNDGPGKLDQWRTLTSARALDATCVLVTAGQARPGGAEAAGQDTGPTGIGHSAVLAADGTRIAEAGYDVATLLVDVDLDEVAAVRRDIPVIALRSAG